MWGMWRAPAMLLMLTTAPPPRAAIPWAKPAVRAKAARMLTSQDSAFASRSWSMLGLMLSR